jgi:hypothetical protein
LRADADLIAGPQQRAGEHGVNAEVGRDRLEVNRFGAGVLGAASVDRTMRDCSRRASSRPRPEG